MLKIKKTTNLISGEKVNKKLGKKVKNVSKKNSEVKSDIITVIKPVKKQNPISKLTTTPKIQNSEVEVIKPEKTLKKLPKPYRNTIEATTKSSRNKVVKKFKPRTTNSENVKPISKKKNKSKQLQGNGDTKSKLAETARSGNPKTNQRTKFGKRFQKKKLHKEGELVPSLEEAPQFDQIHFNSIVKQDKIKRIVQVLNKLVKNESSKMKNSIFSDYRYNLNVACFKVPSVPKRVVKLKVKHSIADEDTLLIVKDLQRGLKIDYEPTNQLYQDLLKDNGIEGIKTVMSFNQLKTEYSTFEMKHKLANTYDYYLCDGAIVGHVVGFLGKIFSSKSRCTPYAVRMANPKLVKSEIQKALHKTSYKQGQKGNLITIPIGTHKMTPGQIADNVVHVIAQLKTIYPGGLPNIRNMTLGINLKGTSSLPIYINMGRPLETTPYIVGPREDKLTKLKDQANQILSQFEFTNNASMVRLIKEETHPKRKRANGLDDEDNEVVPETIVKKVKSVTDTVAIVNKSKEEDSDDEDNDGKKSNSESEENDGSDEDETNEDDSRNEDSN